MVLHEVGFGLEAGDRIGLLGPNGAGKTTLVRTLVGELAPLADELELCREYLELEQLRLGERLVVDWNLKSMPADALVPPLVLPNGMGHIAIIADVAGNAVGIWSAGE